MIYTSRQLLDPSYISNYRNAEEQNYWNRINSLGEAAEQISNIRKERKERQKEQLDLAERQKLIDEMSSSEDFNNPQFRAALYSFQKTGDRSGIDNYYQTKALNKARESEEQKAKEVKIRELNNIEDAIATSEDWNTAAALYEKAIQKANELGDIERMNRLKEEAAAVANREELWKTQKAEEKLDIEKAFAKLKENIKFRIQNLPKNEKERNDEIDALNKLVSDYQIIDIKVPEKTKNKKYRTPAEEDEFQRLSGRVRNNANMSEEDITRYNYLKQFEYKR